MGAPWLVKAKIPLCQCAREFFGQKRHQRHHIGLLHHLGTLCTLSPDYDVYRRREVRISLEIQPLQQIEPSKLFIKAGRRIQRDRDAGDCVSPILQLVIVKCQLVPELFRGMAGPARTQFSSTVSSARPNIPTRHDVGKRVVVHVLVILIRSNHVANMSFPVWLSGCPGSPEPARLQKNLGASAKKKGIIASGAPILPNGIGDVGADVMLHFPGQDVDVRAVGRNQPPGVVSTPVSADSQANSAPL